MPPPQPATPRAWTVAFAVVSGAFLAAAGMHAARALAGDEAGAPRHAVFVLVNLAAAAGVVLRPRGFPLAFAALVLQQLHGHGGEALEAARAGVLPDADDLAVVLFMPAVLALLVAERRRGAAGLAPAAARGAAP